QAIISGQRVASRMEETGDILYASKRYALAWARYIRGEGDAEVRQLISTVDTSAGKIVTPTTLVNRIEDKLKTGGRIVRLCRIENIKGMTEHPVVQSSTNLTWHNETGPVKGEKAINLTSVQIDPQFVAETLAFTKKFEADSIEAFWEWLMAELPDALLRKIDNEILFGAATGTSGIRGILTNTNTLFVQIVSGVILDFNIANLAISALDDGTEDNTTIVMNRRTFFTNIRGLKGADGHPIWTASASEEKPQFYLGGFPVAFNSALPAYDDADIGDAFMVVGDFKAMLLNFPQGMAPNLVRDEITRKKENIVEYLSEIYVGGNITRPGSFAVIQKGDAAVGAVGDIGGFSAGIEFGELQAELAEAKKKIEAFEKEATKAAKAAKVPKADE
ncbi:MAG: phage major capsid protein, partial [Defluviitaleaceae bacterium]|nr:phage major capsid protein [Defluviitaleaceae bacterium]